MARLSRGLRDYARTVTYRIAGLPIAAGQLFRSRREASPAGIVRSAYARLYWHPRDGADLAALLLALLLWPFALVGLEIAFLARNGKSIARSARRSRFRQLLDQTRLYFTSGVLPPWYYVFELHRRPIDAFARDFIYRWESKGGVMALLKEGVREPVSILTDKVQFAAQCEAADIATVPVLAVLRRGRMEQRGALDRDLFVKPVTGRGGKGAERWDLRDGLYRGGQGDIFTRGDLIAQLERRSLSEPLLVQPRLEGHPALAPLSNGALTTVRVLTCLDERREPELVGAAMRMAIGRNHTVDNLHAGGIAAAVDFASGTLGRASDLGTDCRLGWMDSHPVSGARIAGTKVPSWSAIKALAMAAHRVFADRILIGWDIAPTAEGPVVIEANGAPDLDIMQRFIRHGLMAARLGILLAYHLSQLDFDQLPM